MGVYQKLRRLQGTGVGKLVSLQDADRLLHSAIRLESIIFDDSLDFCCHGRIRGRACF